MLVWRTEGNFSPLRTLDGHTYVTRDYRDVVQLRRDGGTQLIATSTDPDAPLLRAHGARRVGDDTIVLTRDGPQRWSGQDAATRALGVGGWNRSNRSAKPKPQSLTEERKKGQTWHFTAERSKGPDRAVLRVQNAKFDPFDRFHLVHAIERLHQRAAFRLQVLPRRADENAVDRPRPAGWQRSGRARGAGSVLRIVENGHGWRI